MAFFHFIASGAGRWTRVLAGAVLMVIGWWAIGGALGLVIGAVGLVPFLAGVLDVCVFAPLWGLPFNGEGVRQATRRQHPEAETRAPTPTATVPDEQPAPSESDEAAARPAPPEGDTHRPAAH